MLVSTGIALAGLVLTAATTAYGIYQQQEAQEESEAIADANAARIEAEAQETARRAEKTAQAERSTARARAAASGVVGLSTYLHLDEMEKEQNRQIDWIRKSGASQADITTREAKATRSTTRAAQAQTIMSGAKDAYDWGSGVNWFKAGGSPSPMSPPQRVGLGGR